MWLNRMVYVIFVRVFCVVVFQPHPHPLPRMGGGLAYMLPFIATGSDPLPFRGGDGGLHTCCLLLIQDQTPLPFEGRMGKKLKNNCSLGITAREPATILKSHSSNKNSFAPHKARRTNKRTLKPAKETF